MRNEYLRIVIEDGAAQSYGVCHQVDLLDRHGVLNVVHSVLEVVQPLVVEEDVVIQILFMALIRSVEIIDNHLP